MQTSLTEFLHALPPGRPALAYGAGTVTAGALAREADRIAGGLRALGVGAGDRVALWLPNVPAWLAIFFACARLGAIAVAVNTRFGAHEVQDILGRAGCRLVVLWPGFRDIDFAGILAAVTAEALADLTDVVVYEEDGPTGGSQPLAPGGRRVTRYEALCAGPPATAPAAPAATRCVIFTTSGTTRAPKFVCHRQAGVVQHARDAAAAWGLTPDRRILQALPLCGVFGFTQALAGLAAGAVLRVMPVFEGRAAAALLEGDGITDMNGSDEMMDRLLDATTIARPFPGLRAYGFARFNPALEDIVARADARGVTMRGLYGMSEVQALYALQPAAAPAEERAKGGGVPVSPAAAARVRDPDSGALLGPGEQGELELTGQSMMAEYFGDPQATRAAFTADGWFRTGDLGHLEPDGRFCYLARLGDVLRLGGYLTSPQEIEAELEGHPDVAASQVVGGVMDGRPVAVAFVVMRPGRELDEAAMRVWCKARMAGYKVPGRIAALREFPVTASANGTKIQRAKLRELAARLTAGQGGARQDADRGSEPGPVGAFLSGPPAGPTSS